MCIGVPMRVISVFEGTALCDSANGPQEIRTRLVGPLNPGDWVLVFLGDAREQIDADRAREVQATLALVQAAMTGEPVAADADVFELPSRMSPAALRGLTGAPAPDLENA